jgi:hypothetical protein
LEQVALGTGMLIAERFDQQRICEITDVERTLIRDAREKIGEPVALQGFVQTVRNQKAVQFIILRDHTGLIQSQP